MADDAYQLIIAAHFPFAFTILIFVVLMMMTFSPVRMQFNYQIRFEEMGSQVLDPRVTALHRIFLLLQVVRCFVIIRVLMPTTPLLSLR